MPSPDVVSYFGLELAQLDEQTLVDTGLANAVETFPDWTPREGNTEVVVLEQVAAMVANLGYLINQLPNGMAEVLLRLFEVDRDTGQPPATTLRFVLTDTIGHTIPAGTVARLDLGDNVDPLDFITDVDLVVAPGASEGTVVATAADATSIANGTLAGRPLELLDAIAYVDSVALYAIVAGGTDPEDQVTFLARAAPVLGRLTSTLVRAEDVTTFVAALNPLVTRVKVVDLYNGEAGALPSTSPAPAPGYVTVAVAGVNGSVLTQAVKDGVAAQLVNRLHAGLTLWVQDADLFTIRCRVTVTRQAAATSVDVDAAVHAALAAYLDPNTWPWSPIVRHNELIAVVDAATGVDTVDLVEHFAVEMGGTFGVIDVPLDSYVPLAQLGATVVTVNDPT